MLVGAIDPMEGSIIILPGSGAVALGTYLSQGKCRTTVYRTCVFALIVLGVGALWGLTMVGGFGGTSGRSQWWGLLILPYLIGWSMGIWGPGSPRWVLAIGIAVGVLYLAILAIVLLGSGLTVQALPAIVIGTLGALTIGGCIIRLRSQNASR